MGGKDERGDNEETRKRIADALLSLGFPGFPLQGFQTGNRARAGTGE